VTRLFAGQGPGYDLARRACFDKLVHTNTMATPVTQRLERALLGCTVIVSVMNPHVARWAAQHGVPCIYVDSLLWMWATPPSVPPGVRYFQEDWPGSAARLEEWRHLFHEPEIVGPLVSPPARERPDDPDVVMINFGGMSCAMLDAPTLLTYAESMARCALTAVDDWPGRVVVTAGRHVTDHMDREALRAIRPDVEIVDLSHDAYLAELRRARLLISSAGTHAIFEACAWGVPTIYVPGQNLSQVLCLEALVREAVVSQPLDWGELYGLTGLDIADEAGACGRIAESIHRFGRDAAAREAVIGHLRASMDDEHLSDLTRRQTRFFLSLGAMGAPRIATHILDLLRSSMLEPAS
jgi:Glycosyltransferase family 28 C-terminal domain